MCQSHFVDNAILISYHFKYSGDICFDIFLTLKNYRNLSYLIDHMKTRSRADLLPWLQLFSPSHRLSISLLLWTVDLGVLTSSQNGVRDIASSEMWLSLCQDGEDAKLGCIHGDSEL